jgi:hypothetical protein
LPTITLAAAWRSSVRSLPGKGEQLEERLGGVEVAHLHELALGRSDEQHVLDAVLDASQQRAMAGHDVGDRVAVVGGTLAVVSCPVAVPRDRPRSPAPAARSSVDALWSSAAGRRSRE